jgi:hypothetical protein
MYQSPHQSFSIQTGAANNQTRLWDMQKARISLFLQPCTPNTQAAKSSIDKSPIYWTTPGIYEKTS